MSKLTDPEVEQGLSELVEWARVGDQIVKKWRFASPARALVFLNSAAELAEDLGQTPEIVLHGRDVRIELATHAEGGLTEGDFKLARQIDQLPIER